MTAWAMIVEACAQPLQEKWERPSETKRCSACGEVKPNADFYARKTHSPNALSSECKPCTVERVKAAKKKRKQLKENHDIRTLVGVDHAG